MSEVPNLGGLGKSVPTGRGIPIGNVTGAPSGLSGPGRGVGIPNLMNVMPSMGRGMTPIQQGMPRMPAQQMGNFQGMMQPGMGNMVRPQIINPMMIRPPMSNNF